MKLEKIPVLEQIFWLAIAALAGMGDCYCYIKQNPRRLRFGGLALDSRAGSGVTALCTSSRAIAATGHNLVVFSTLVEKMSSTVRGRLHEIKTLSTSPHQRRYGAASPWGLGPSAVGKYEMAGRTADGRFRGETTLRTNAERPKTLLLYSAKKWGKGGRLPQASNRRETP